MKLIIYFISYLYPEKIIKAIKYVLRLMRSYYYKRKLNAGNNFYVFSVRNIKGEDNISIGDNFNAGKQLRLEAWIKYQDKIYSPQIKIGNNVLLGDDNHIGAINEIIIGDNLLTGSNVYITDHNHGASIFADMQIAPVERILHSKGKVRIENNVWLGNNVVIMPDVVIGTGAVVGANSVVTKSIPAYSVAAGIPAKIIRTSKADDIYR